MYSGLSGLHNGLSELWQRSARLGAAIQDIVASRYELIEADSLRLKYTAHKMRQTVLGEELGYEPRGRELEVDDYDQHSTQFLLLDRKRNTYVGCTRFVHAQYKGYNYRLPFQAVCGNKLDPAYLKPLQEDPKSCVEVSRFMTPAEYRGNTARCPVASTFVALMMGVQVQAEKRGTPHLYALVEGRLRRSMSKSIGPKGPKDPIQEIGEPVEFHKKRVPILMHTADIRARMGRTQTVLYHMTKLRAAWRPASGVEDGKNSAWEQTLVQPYNTHHSRRMAP